jgi:ribose transport system substrate-binding protein
MEEKMKKLALVSLFFVLFGLTAFAGGKQDAKPTKAPGQYTVAELSGLEIACLPKTLNNDYYVALNRGLEDEAKKYGIKVVSMAPPAETDYEAQINMVETVVQRKSAAIAISPTDANALVDAVKEAQNAGIPVFNVDSPLAEDFTTGRCGTDNFAGGYKAGEWMGNVLGGKGTVVVIDGSDGNANGNARRDGFQKAIADKYSGIKVMNAIHGYMEVARGQEAAESVLTAEPNLSGIFCCNDEMAVGVANVLAERKKTGQVLVCGYDGAPNAVQLILDGVITASVAQLPATMGRIAVQQFVEYMTTGKLANRNQDTGSALVTKENASQYLSWQ